MQIPPDNTPILPETPRCRRSRTEGGRGRRPRHGGRFGHFMRGYLMLVGALTTLYVLVQLLVRLFVELGKWAPTMPLG